MSKGTSFKNASIKQLERALQIRKNAKIEELRKECNKIEQKIIELGGSIDTNTTGVVEALVSPNKTPRIKKSMQKTRILNDKSLKDHLMNIASDGKARSATDFLTELKNSGWKSQSAKPYYVVAAALAAQEKKNVFRRIDRGTYELVKNSIIA